MATQKYLNTQAAQKQIYAH